MSSNGDVASKPSAAINVGFSSIADRNGESSSRAESRSSGKRSSHSEKRDKSSKDSNKPNDDSKRRTEERASGESSGRKVRSSGGFLLDSVFANGSPPGPQDRGKRKAQDGQLRVDKRRHGPGRLSNESSMQSSPLSRDVSMEISNASERGEESTSRTPSMDPAQLVQMALNLSENRKRHASNSLQVPLASPRRAVSGVMSNFGTVRATSVQKRNSQLGSGYGNNSPDQNIRDNQDQREGDSMPMDFVQDNVFHTFSPATLSRAEKARKYFELANEHRRLLEHLPPLKPDSTAPGNYTFESVSSPGSAFPQISRVPSGVNNKHILGREYNPIQALRNRRIRIREKLPFSAPPETWQDPDKVKTWIDEVGGATRDPYFRATTNRAHLPTFDGDDETAATQAQASTAKHRRTETAGSVITRPENSWTIEPTELLADAYWTEKSDNKSLIESRHGNTIFPSLPRHSSDTPKISIEMHRGRSDNVAEGKESDDGDDSIRHSRRRRLMLPLKGNAEKRNGRHLRNRSTSRSSGSSTEDGFGRSSASKRMLGDDNIGPLERHMQELIAKDANGELTSPEVISPDHWDLKNLPYPRGRQDAVNGPMTPPNGRASLEVPRDHHRRARSADGRVGSVDAAMSSTEDLASGPSSPVNQHYVPSIGMDLSPPARSRRSLDGERSRMKLPSFRSSSKERNGVGQYDFADGAVSTLAAAAATNLSPILSNDSWHPRSSQDSGRPKHFQRHQTNESSASELRKVDTHSSNTTFSSARESDSTVGRFLKGGRDRLGGIVRGDRPRFSDRFKTRDKLDGGLSDVSRGASDVEDVEDVKKVNGNLKNRLPDAADDDSDVSPRASLDRTRPKPKYHLSGLPAFTSTAKRPHAGDRAITSNPQEKTLREDGKLEASDRLAPPHINIPQGRNTSSPDLPAFKFPAVKFAEPRKSYGDLAAFGTAALAVSPFGSVSRSPAQRHWSIYDQAQPIKSDKITSRDIARVRALLLCSGIKAREIQRLSNLPRETPSKDLITAAKTTGQKLESVPMKEEHLVAARMLSAHLSTSFSDFEMSLSHFQSQTVAGLASRLDELHHRTSDQLTNLVHDTSDEADAFTVELTTRQPQQTKQVDDAIDAMIRQRRRQFRFLRRAGFKLLEWLVLSILWGLWFLVVVFNTGKKTVVSIFRFLRWLFVF